MYQPPQQKRNNWLVYILSGCLLVSLCGICVAGIAISGLTVVDRRIEEYNLTQESGGDVLADLFPSPTPLGATSTLLPPTPSSTPSALTQLGATPTNPPATATTVAIVPTPLPGFAVPAEIVQIPLPAAAHTWAEQLLRANYPINDFYEVALRLDSVHPGERLRPAEPYTVGDTQSFITDSGRATAVLVAITEHTYFWFEEGTNFDQARAVEVANEFESKYYPRIANLFGGAWTPGIDNDPRFSILHLDSFVGGELGFFDSSDEFPSSVIPTSNEQEIIYMNLDSLTPGSDLYYGTLVHEFQHLAQWNLDANETVWLDEGMAQLAEIYVGLNTASALDYLDEPSTQLNSWDYDDDNVFAHYAAAYLFSTYLWEQLGDAAVQELARVPGNGMQAVQTVLEGYLPDVSLQTFLAEWAVANLLDRPELDSRYGYRSLTLPPPDRETSLSLGQSISRTLPQFGVHYLDVDASGPVTIRFAGDTTAPLVDVDPFSGPTMWFAPGVDNTNSHLTASFDLTGINDAVLSFRAWYDLEEDYDFAYVSVSLDNGASWELLPLDHQSSGVYGPALNGRSERELTAQNGWVEERISLAQYGNRPVLIRFEIQTDAGIPSHGLALDDIRIDALGYVGDDEAADTTWLAEGFIAVGSQLPQYWSVVLVDDATNTVTFLDLTELNQGIWQGELGPQGGTLIVMPQTPFAQDTGSYWVAVDTN
ncbi:MAG: immune inhibitor A [Anaerolineales bacterium]|nr:immune inhibitor A [Anaerolineales bacterium]MCB0006797.1 immune inhibitor A [Anaerolineales bacterium]MCB0017844.1 immune inhibitor A [Anaerolineales bacterium]